ncbi:MAG: FISUMP domain-containing protein [Dysgonamonadaceae bacterium]
MKTQINRKLIYRGFPLLLAAAFMSGCSTEDKASLSGSGMRFTLGGVNDMPVETRSAVLDSFPTVSVPLDNGFLMECTLKAEEPSRTKATTPFAGNNTFRIFANDGSNVTDKGQFAAGSGNIILNLAPGSYTFSAYSFNNTASLPALPSGTTLISGISPDNDLLFWESDNIAIADNTNETRTITFNHLFSQVQVVVKANNGISDLAVSGLSATLNVGYTANMDVITGSLTSSGSPLTQPLTWASTGTTATSNYCTIYPGTTDAVNLDFTLSSVTVGGTTYTNKTVPFTGITLIPGKRYILNVNIYPLLFSPIYNVNTGTTILNRSAVFAKGSGDNKTRGTGVAHSSMSAGVFKYYNGGGRSYSAVSTTKDGITVSVPAGTMNMQSGEIPVSVSGTPATAVAGKAFDIPITILGQQLYVRVNVGCGAYTAAPTIPSLNGDAAWKQFQCFNLGANTTTTTASPLIANQYHHGAKYRWGAKNASYTMVQDQSNSGTITGWSDNSTANFPFQTTLADWDMSSNNPCPAGWRVPTYAEWQNVINTGLNVQTVVGVFSTSDNDYANYNAGRKFGESLFLPAAGYRYPTNGRLLFRGNYGWYWCSTGYNPKDAYGLGITGSQAVLERRNRADGSSVRCIAE